MVDSYVVTSGGIPKYPSFIRIRDGNGSSINTLQQQESIPVHSKLSDIIPRDVFLLFIASNPSLKYDNNLLSVD